MSCCTKQGNISPKTKTKADQRRSTQENRSITEDELLPQLGLVGWRCARLTKRKVLCAAHVGFHFCLQVKTSRQISAGDQTEGDCSSTRFPYTLRRYIFAEWAVWPHQLSSTFAVSALCFRTCFIMLPPPPPSPPTPLCWLNKEWQSRDTATSSQVLALELKS